MIPGFDAAVADMEVGQIVDVHLMPEEAYGMPDPNAVFTARDRTASGIRRSAGWAAGLSDQSVWTALPGESGGKGRDDDYF